MLEKLKEFIGVVMERGIVDSLPSRFMNIIDDFDDDVIHEGFMTEVRELVKNGTIKPVNRNADDGACYYLFRIYTGDVDYNTFTILYKSHENSDVAWIFGFPNNLVLCSEYDISNDGKNEIVTHEGSYRAYDWDDRFITLMSGYFTSMDLDIL